MVEKNLLDEARALVIKYQRGSISLVQRRLAISYNAATALMEQLAQEGLVVRVPGKLVYNMVEPQNASN